MARMVAFSVATWQRPAASRRETVQRRGAVLRDRGSAYDEGRDCTSKVVGFICEPPAPGCARRS